MPKNRPSRIRPDFNFDENRFQGEFPARLTAKHLPKLNAVFESFARGLRDAAILYKGGSHSGRDGATACLININMFLSMFDIIVDDNLNGPLTVMISALVALNQNNQLPIVTPIPSTGRAKSSSMRNVLEGWAVVTVERIMGTGMPLNKACDTVAKHLVKAGIKPTRGKSPISGRTVRNWKQRASEDVGMLGAAAFARKMFGDFVKPIDSTEGISVEDALDHLLILVELALPSDLR